MFPKIKLTNCLILFLASAFQAFGMYNIHALADITEGGVLGAVLLIEYWLHVSPAVSSFLLNEPLSSPGRREPSTFWPAEGGGATH